MVALFFFSYFPSFLEFYKVCDYADTPAPYEMRTAKRTVVPLKLHPQNAQTGLLRPAQLPALCSMLTPWTPESSQALSQLSVLSWKYLPIARK